MGRDASIRGKTLLAHGGTERTNVHKLSELRFAAEVDGGMTLSVILEVAALNVRPGQVDEFEQAFAKAQSIISGMPGYQQHEVRLCLEVANKYLLLVWWDDLQSHTVGFRQSPEYQEWKQLLHHFYDPFPVVEHFEVVEGLRGRATSG